MRKFYLTKNNCGYYRVHFVDPKTGKKLKGKSTHTKDKTEATIIATEWLRDGIPEFRSNSRLFTGSDKNDNFSGVDLEALVSRLSDNEIKKLLELISKKQNYVISVSPNATPFSILPQQTITNQVAQTVLQQIPQNSQIPQHSQIPQSQISLQSNVPLQTSRKQFPVLEKSSKQCTEEKSTSTKSKNHNLALPEKLTQENGLCKFIESFWDYDTSRYIAEQNALGKKMTQKHCKEMYQIVNRHWRPYFGDDITAEMLDTETLMDFFFYLHFDKGLAGATVNKAINCGKKAVDYLYKKKMIPENPFLGVERFAPNGIERGIPTETEVKELMGMTWENKVGKLAFTLSTFMGLRAGEISGLQVCDIDLDAELLHLRHSWNVVDKLKGLKNGETRSVPCDRETLMQLLFQARRNPMYSDTSFVFWSSQKPEQPFHPNYYEESFYDSLHKIGVSEEQRQERVLVFHSLRHFCATLLRQRMDLATVQEILGHKSEIMTKHYSDHESKSKFAIMREALNDSRNAILKSA